jgi:hypothetical protein
VWGRYCACEILIASLIDWLYAACLEYIIFFLDRQFRSYNTIWLILSVNHANNNLCTWQNACSKHRVDISLWFKRMELIEVKSLIRAQKGKLYIIYEHVMGILGILRFKSIHLIFYTFIHIIHMYISNDSNVILKYFHFVLLVVFFLEPQFYTAHAQHRTTFVNCFSSSMIMRFSKINNTVYAIFIYSFIYA